MTANLAPGTSACMHALRQAIRILALLTGLFLFVGGLVDLAGWIPAVDDKAFGIVDRLGNDWPVLLAGLVLMVPHRRALAQPRYGVLFVAHLLLAAVIGLRLVQTLMLVQRGDIDRLALPVALACLAIPLANLWALHASKRASATV